MLTAFYKGIMNWKLKSNLSLTIDSWSSTCHIHTTQTRQIRHTSLKAKIVQWHREEEESEKYGCRNLKNTGSLGICKTSPFQAGQKLIKRSKNY